MVYGSLKDRIVVITGGGRGFGREFALAFARQGAKIVVTAARNSDELGQTVTDANSIAPGCCVGTIADVASAKDAERVIALAVDRFGGADVLVNNAARSPAESAPNFNRDAPQSFWDADPEAYARVVETNVTGPFLMARAIMPVLLKREYGRIINLSTSRPTMVLRGAGPYGATKAALEASTMVWARDLEGSTITVNAVLPGAASDTSLIPGDNIGSRALSAAAIRSSNRGEQGRMPGLLPADIVVPPVLWLASSESSAWNGRRFVAKDWDGELLPEEAATQAATAYRTMPEVL